MSDALRTFVLVLLVLVLPGAAVAQTGRFPSAGVPNAGLPELALFPGMAALNQAELGLPVADLIR